METAAATRTLTDHKVNGLNEALQITVMDEPGPGGANHHYMVTLPDWTRNPDGSAPHHVWDVQFQNGPIATPADFNGLTGEALIAIVIDRMRGFQGVLPPTAEQERVASRSGEPVVRGQFACKENAMALTHLEEALMWLQKRTLDRMKRGVEGSNKP